MERSKSRSLKDQTLGIGRCRLKIICMVTKFVLTLDREKPKHMSEIDWNMLNRKATKALYLLLLQMLRSAL